MKANVDLKGNDRDSPVLIDSIDAFNNKRFSGRGNAFTR